MSGPNPMAAGDAGFVGAQDACSRCIHARCEHHDGGCLVATDGKGDWFCACPGFLPTALVHLCPRCGEEITPPADHYNGFASFWLCDSRTWPVDCDCGGEIVLVEIDGSHYICRACGARYEEAQP